MKDRQVEILEAAGALLNEQGLGGLTIKNLARKVGFTEAAVYRHFDSKEAIVAALLEHLQQSLAERLTPILKDPSASPLEKIHRIFLRQLEFLIERPEFLTATFSESMLSYSSVVNVKMTAIITRMQQTMLQLVTSGQAAGEITTIIPPADIMAMLLGSFRFLLQRWQMAPQDFDIQKTGPEHMKNLIKLISKV